MKDNFTADYVRGLMPESEFSYNELNAINSLQNVIERAAEKGRYSAECLVMLKSYKGYSEEKKNVEKYFIDNGFSVSASCCCPDAESASHFRFIIFWSEE